MKLHSGQKCRPTARLLIALLACLTLFGVHRGEAQSLSFTVQTDPSNVAFTGLSEVLGPVFLIASPSCGTEADGACISRAGTIEVRFPNITIDNTMTTGIRICESVNQSFECDSSFTYMTGTVTVTSNSLVIGVNGEVNFSANDFLTISGVRARVAQSVLSTIGTEATVTFSATPSNVASFQAGTFVVARSADPLTLLIHAVPEVPCEPEAPIPTVQVIEGYSTSFVDHGDAEETSFPGVPVAPRTAFGGNANTRIRVTLTGLMPGIQVNWPTLVTAQNSLAKIDLLSQAPDGSSATYIYGSPNQVQTDGISEIFAIRLPNTRFTFTGSGSLSGLVSLRAQLLPPATPDTVRPRFEHPLEPEGGEPFFLLRRCAAGPSGRVQTRAVVDGVNWSGSLNYRLQGPVIFNGTRTEIVEGLPTGSYTASYVSGGPAGATFTGISPASTLNLLAGGTIGFVFNFTGPTFASLELQSTPVTACPSANTQVGTFQLVNTSADQQIIPGGATFTFTFSAPIVSAPTITGLGNITPNIAGATMSFSIPGSVSLMPGASLTFSGMRLNMSSVADGLTATVQFASTPTAAIQVPVNQVTLASASTALCPPPVPVFSSTGVTNGASFIAGAAAGSILSLFGSDLTEATGIVTAGVLPLPTQLSGVSVTANDIAAPLFAVAGAGGQEQINFQMPWEVAGQTSVAIEVRNGTLVSAPVQVNLLETHPGVFTVDGTTGAILHGTTSALVTGSNPALPGEIVILYATGLGPVSFPPATGAAALADPLSLTTLTSSVTVDGIPATVRFSGLAPGFVGLYQINVELPAGVSSGSRDLVVESGGRTSKPVKIAIQ
jgi:uncharacterized protein (TIGR03437 family)